MIKLKMKLVLSALATAVLAAPLSTAFAVDTPRKRVCYTDFAQQIKTVQREKASNVCRQVDTSVNVENSPYIYTNPDAGCDLGFSMPGLPDIGIGLDGINSCELLKAVTGDLVKDINKEMQGAVADAIDAVGGETEFGIDLGDVSTGLINGEDVDVINNNRNVTIPTTCEKGRNSNGTCKGG